jgi:hypothetical protein
MGTYLNVWSPESESSVKGMRTWIVNREAQQHGLLVLHPHWANEAMDPADLDSLFTGWMAGWPLPQDMSLPANIKGVARGSRTFSTAVSYSLQMPYFVVRLKRRI